MKVVFDHQIFFSQRYGGISRYFRELSMRLSQKRGMEVSVVAPFHTNEYLRRNHRPSLGWPYFGYEFRGSNRIQTAARQMLLPRLYSRHQDSDVVHETYFSETPFGTGRVRVTTMYDMIYEIFPNYFKYAAEVTRAKRASVKRCDHVLCISESARNDLIKIFDIEPEKTSVVHLGYSLAQSAGPADAAVSRSGRPFILYVGNRALYKNFTKLVESFATSRRLMKSFDIVAFGGPAFGGDEKALFNRLGVTDRLEYISGDDGLLESYYRGAGVFVFPSLYEGFGIPPLEAMSFDCPVVCSETSSIPEVVADAAVYFDPESVDSIRTAIERVIDSESLRADLIVKGRQRLRVFSWDRCADETAAIYEAVRSRAA